NISENNGICGRIPNSICSLSKLKQFDLDNNKLDGFVPESIGNLKKLKLLNLENNQLSGTLPDSLKNLDALENINVKGNGSLIGYLPEINNLKSCSYDGTNLCVKENSKVCSNNLRKCTSDDMKKVEVFNKNINRKEENVESKQNSGETKSSKAVVIVIIVIILIAIIIGAIFYIKYRNKNNKRDDGYGSQSKLNILPVSKRDSINRSKTEKSFVVLTPKGDVVDQPPQLALDESIFNYVDIKKQNKKTDEEEESKDNSRISTDIKTQEQYENHLQYENLLHSQNYYLD
ncbi:hypothetical protein PIROE2DRAFT_65026, partial [Piromyces sp. E2]